VRAAAALNGVVSHASAAACHGWEMKRAAARPTVTVPRNRKVAAVRRAGVDVKWRDLPPEQVVPPGLTSPARTVVDCARCLPFDEALAIADSALRHGDVTREELLALAGTVPSTGRRQALRVARDADGRAANPFESVLRAIALDVPGLCFEPQKRVREGSFVCWPDLVDDVRRVAAEADSFEFHGKRRLLKRDCVRYNALAVRGWLVLRFTWEHVMFEPAYIRRTLTEAAAWRAQRPQRRAALPGKSRIPA
jgi:very-short-patch-repair endonuclease